MNETIIIGGLRLTFLHSRHDTDDSVDIFRMTVAPNARMPVAHYHDSWDETVYGLSGTTHWRVDGEDIPVGPGDSLFIKRGVVHAFDNRTDADATCLSVLTPGVLGPDYFREIAALVAAGKPDPAVMTSIMTRYGLIPVPDTD